MTEQQLLALRTRLMSGKAPQRIGSVQVDVNGYIDLKIYFPNRLCECANWIAEQIEAVHPDCDFVCNLGNDVIAVRIKESLVKADYQI